MISSVFSKLLFSGVYLPLLWEPSFCIRSPLSLGYTRGHFSALVPIEPYSSPETGANNLSNQENLQVTFLPLMDHNRKLLPVHFLTESEVFLILKLYQIIILKLLYNLFIKKQTISCIHPQKLK